MFNLPLCKVRALLVLCLVLSPVPVSLVLGLLGEMLGCGLSSYWFKLLFMSVNYSQKLVVMNVVVRELAKTYPSLGKYSALSFLAMVDYLEGVKHPTTLASISWALASNGKKTAFRNCRDAAEPVVIDGLLRRTASYRYYMTTAGRVALDLFNKYMANATPRIKSKDVAIKGLRGS